MYTHIPQGSCGNHRSTTELIVPSHCVSPKAGTEVISLGSKALDSLNHLIWPHFAYLPPKFPLLVPRWAQQNRECSLGMMLSHLAAWLRAPHTGEHPLGTMKRNSRYLSTKYPYIALHAWKLQANDSLSPWVLWWWFFEHSQILNFGRSQNPSETLIRQILLEDCSGSSKSGWYPGVTFLVSIQGYWCCRHSNHIKSGHPAHRVCSQNKKIDEGIVVSSTYWWMLWQGLTMVISCGLECHEHFS